MVLEKTLESPLDCKIQPVNPKVNEPWIFIGRTDTEAETAILWPPDAKNWLTRKDPEAWKDWRQAEKRATEDEMFGWHYGLDGCEFEWALGVGDEQGSLSAAVLGWQRVGHDGATKLNWVFFASVISVYKYIYTSVFWLCCTAYRMFCWPWIEPGLPQ